MAAPASNGVLSDVVESIWTPGTNTGLIKAMNASFYALFATLLVMLFLTSGNGHVWALLGLSLGLFLSIKWFLVQISDVEESRRVERLAKEADELKGAKEGKAE